MVSPVFASCPNSSNCPHEIRVGFFVYLLYFNKAFFLSAPSTWLRTKSLINFTDQKRNAYHVHSVLQGEIMLAAGETNLLNAGV